MRVALPADPVATAVTQVVDDGVMLAVPGAVEAGATRELTGPGRGATPASAGSPGSRARHPSPSGRTGSGVSG